MKGKLSRARACFRAVTCLLAAALTLTALGSSLALADKEPAPPQTAFASPGTATLLSTGPADEAGAPPADVEQRADPRPDADGSHPTARLDADQPGTVDSPPPLSY